MEGRLGEFLREDVDVDVDVVVDAAGIHAPRDGMEVARVPRGRGWVFLMPAAWAMEALGRRGWRRCFVLRGTGYGCRFSGPGIMPSDAVEGLDHVRWGMPTRSHLFLLLLEMRLLDLLVVAQVVENEGQSGRAL